MRQQPEDSAAVASLPRPLGAHETDPRARVARAPSAQLDAKRRARHRSARDASPTEARDARDATHGARRAARNSAHCARRAQTEEPGCTATQYNRAAQRLPRTLPAALASNQIHFQPERRYTTPHSRQRPRHGVGHLL
jgi:hypothetical protein